MTGRDPQQGGGGRQGKLAPGYQGMGRYRGERGAPVRPRNPVGKRPRGLRFVPGNHPPDQYLHNFEDISADSAVEWRKKHLYSLFLKMILGLTQLLHGSIKLLLNGLFLGCEL